MAVSAASSVVVRLSPAMTAAAVARSSSPSSPSVITSSFQSWVAASMPAFEVGVQGEELLGESRSESRFDRARLSDGDVELDGFVAVGGSRVSMRMAHIRESELSRQSAAGSIDQRQLDLASAPASTDLFFDVGEFDVQLAPGVPRCAVTSTATAASNSFRLNFGGGLPTHLCRRVLRQQSPAPLRGSSPSTGATGAGSAIGSEAAAGIVAQVAGAATTGATAFGWRRISTQMSSPPRAATTVNRSSG